MSEILGSTAAPADPPAGGRNSHTLVADPGTCRWSTGILDRTGLALGALTTTSAAYIIHPEHGGSGIAREAT